MSPEPMEEPTKTITRIPVVLEVHEDERSVPAEGSAICDGFYWEGGRKVGRVVLIRYTASSAPAVEFESIEEEGVIEKREKAKR